MVFGTFDRASMGSRVIWTSLALLICLFEDACFLRFATSFGICLTFAFDFIFRIAVFGTNAWTQFIRTISSLFWLSYDAGIRILTSECIWFALAGNGIVLTILWTMLLVVRALVTIFIKSFINTNGLLFTSGDRIIRLFAFQFVLRTLDWTKSFARIAVLVRSLEFAKSLT